MSSLYIAAGALHLVKPALFRRLMPPYLPAHDLLILLSGLAEIALGLMVLWPTTRSIGAWGLTALLIAVFPANVQMVVEREGVWAKIPSWILWTRLPLQPLLIAWAYAYTK